MNLQVNEKQYYDKVVELYSKYGEDIPDADLMHLSVIERELGISFQRSQEIFELAKNQADNVEAVVSPVVEMPKEANVVEDVEDKKNVPAPKDKTEAPEIHCTSIKRESKTEKSETIVSSVVGTKQDEEIPSVPLESQADNSDVQAIVMSDRQENVEKSSDTANKDLASVEDPGEINKWKVIFWYTIGFFTIIFWGIGLLIMIWETIVVIRHKNKQIRYAKYIIEQDKAQ